MASPLVKNWVRYELAARALTSVAARLREAGVPVVPVKGIVLARWLYDDVGERGFSDVDLLVRRSDFSTACGALATLGRPSYYSTELGECEASVDGIHVELQAEMARRGLTDLSVDDVVARASVDTETFAFPILRLDEVDHLLLVALNAVKDGFVFAGAHVPADLERLLARVDASEVVGRARDVGFATGLYCTAEWMAEAHGSGPWEEVMRVLGPPRRRLHVAAFRAFWRFRRPPSVLGLALACWSHDRLAPRSVAVGRMISRHASRLVGLVPR